MIASILAAAIAAAFAAVFAPEFFNRRIRRPADLMSRLGIQPLVTIPYIARTKRRPRRRKSIDQIDPRTPQSLALVNAGPADDYGKGRKGNRHTMTDFKRSRKLS